MLFNWVKYTEKPKGEHHPPLRFTTVKKNVLYSPADVIASRREPPTTTVYLCPAYQGWRKTWSCPPPPLCRMFWRSWTEPGSAVVILGSLSADFICHGWRATPEGRLDTLRWLSLPQYISVFSLSPYLQLMSAPLPPTHQHFLLLAFAVSVLYRNLHTPYLPLFVSLCSTEPGLWTSYSSQEGTSTRTSHAMHRWVSVSIQLARLSFKLAHPAVI